VLTTKKRIAARNEFKEWIVNIFLWIIGGALYAVSVNMFLAPNEIINGGFTGLATLINHITGFPIGAAVFILNIPLFFISYKKFGFKFIFRTAIATLITSFLIDYMSGILPVYRGDRLLSALFGAVTAGGGLSLVFMRNATTGGVDIIAKILREKYPHLSLGNFILLSDLIITALSFAVYKDTESVLYSIIVIFLSSRTIDYILYGAGRGKLLYIITDKSDEISARIIKDMKRGVSVLKITGGYTEREKRLLLCAVKTQEATRLTKAVYETDENAFVIISDAGEILGEGFKANGT